MEINKSEYIISSPDVKKCPDTDMPEFAFIGRSNVGKSSLINMLTNHRGLAKTSQTPGKTLLINHFKINDKWWIVDLPGYGYAKIGKDNTEKLRKLINGYVLHREQMTCLFVLIDCRHAPMKVDLDFITMLGMNGIPFAIVFTKLDKISNRQWQMNFKAYKAKLSEEWEELPPMFATSAEKGTGRAEVLAYIDSIMNPQTEVKTE